MRTIIIIIFFLMATTVAWAQDYQTVISGRTALFADHNGFIKALRIDSVKYETDSILYPFAVIQQLDHDCYSPYIASWIGKEIIKKESGVNYFFNKNNDTITLRTNAILDESWVAFEIANSLTIEATVLIHNKKSFLGIVDSVKTIGFQAYDKQMNPIDMKINEMFVEISKYYGLIKTLNFYFFPDIETDYPYNKTEELNLVGLSDPEAGIQNLTWFEVHDFDTDDELHIIYENSCWPEGSAITDKSILKYLTRIDYADSIIYTISRRQSIFTQYSESSDFKYFNDTIHSVIIRNPFFDMLPGEPLIDDHHMNQNHMIVRTNEHSLKYYNYHEGFWLAWNETCWERIIFCGCLTNDLYIQGLSGPYFHCEQIFCEGSIERKLVYWKKGGTSSGTPLVITSTEDNPIKTNLKIYPNPTKHKIIVSTGNSFNNSSVVSIYDMQGRLLKSQIIQSDSIEIDVSELSTGIFILKVSDNNRMLHTEKLIIR